jgi:Uma2 family endonuclease
VSPKHRHGVVQITLGHLLLTRGRGRGTVASEWRFKLGTSESELGRTELVPDIAWVSYERWRPLSAAEKQEPRFAPDIAVEIRSPDDRLSNVLWKMRAYLDHGSLLALDVLPEERRITLYAKDGIHEFALGETFSHASVPWLRFKVHEAFADLEPDE